MIAHALIEDLFGEASEKHAACGTALHYHMGHKVAGIWADVNCPDCLAMIAEEVLRGGFVERWEADGG